jgi:hypothetical protein
MSLGFKEKPSFLPISKSEEQPRGLSLRDFRKCMRFRPGEKCKEN